MDQEEVVGVHSAVEKEVDWERVEYEKEERGMPRVEKEREYVY